MTIRQTQMRFSDCLVVAGVRPAMLFAFCLHGQEGGGMKPFERVFQIVKGIPLGKVMTYGEVAKKAGVTPKMVGWALHANKNPKEIPCHRVVMKDGSMAPGYVFGGPGEQKRKLTEEGVKFEGEKVKSETSEKDKIKNIILGDFSF